MEEGMNKTKIEWCDYTWNPITGCWGPGGNKENPRWCSYCYARRIAMRFWGSFEPKFHPERLNEPGKIKKPSIIFADSMGDFWSDGVKDEWRKAVYDKMRECPQHIFMILTKRPERINAENIPKNAWVGASVTRFEDHERATSIAMKGLDKTFISIEPMLDNDIILGWRDIFMAGWIIIGAETGRKNAFKPSKETIKDIIKEARAYDIPVFIKDNVKWRVKHQDFPDELKNLKILKDNR
uniref:DUF5131 family protein n=1 Tax=viral metagenome TaxID=1070528 RepID=A0A6M3K3U0_9ZZZZ